MFDGLGLHLGNLSRLSNARTRSLSPENFTGEKGKGGMSTDGPAAKQARDLGQGWKVSPYVKIAAGQEFSLADIRASGAIQHIWLTPTGNSRVAILRIYWDDSPTPSVETPLCDFFAHGWQKFSPLVSLPICINPANGLNCYATGCALAPREFSICINPANGLNCYWEMPFRKRARMTLTNLGQEELTLYYEITYTETEVPADAAYFHAQFRRVNPLPYKSVYTILDGVRGKGHYVGTYLAWGVNNTGWWGEGEVKFYLDGDSQFPTLCGTGTEDYFCGSYNFDPGCLDKTAPRAYREFCTPYAGLAQVIRPDGAYASQTRFGMYRWHILDPIRFEQDLRVTVQALGWRSDGRYLPLQDDIASVAYWYQTLPAAPFPPLPDKDSLEVI